MARQERNSVDYFPFLCKEGRVLFYIETKYGNDGFATWVKILRQLAVTNYHYLNLNSKIDVMFLAAKCKVSEEVLVSIVNDLVDMGEFDKQLWNECRVIWCEKFIENIKDAYKKRNNECITYDGLLSLLKSLGVSKGLKSTLKGSVKPQSKVKESIEEETKEDESKKAFHENSLFGNQVMFSMVEMALDSFFKNNQLPKEFQPDFFEEWVAANSDKKFDDISHVRNSMKYMAQEKGKVKAYHSKQNGKGQSFTKTAAEWAAANDPNWKSR